MELDGAFLKCAAGYGSIDTSKKGVKWEFMSCSFNMRPCLWNLEGLICRRHSHWLILISTKFQKAHSYRETTKNEYAEFRPLFTVMNKVVRLPWTYTGSWLHTRARIWRHNIFYVLRAPIWAVVLYTRSLKKVNGLTATLLIPIKCYLGITLLGFRRLIFYATSISLS